MNKVTTKIRPVFGFTLLFSFAIPFVLAQFQIKAIETAALPVTRYGQHITGLTDNDTASEQAPGYADTDS